MLHHATAYRVVAEHEALQRGEKERLPAPKWNGVVDGKGRARAGIHEVFMRREFHFPGPRILSVVGTNSFLCDSYILSSSAVVKLNNNKIEASNIILLRFIDF